MDIQNEVAVYGASGHTGRFVVAELLARGYVPVLSGRDEDRLRASAPGLEVRAAAVGDPGALDRAVAGTAAVVNCAGPFAETAGPVVGAALRAGIPYVGVAAEIESIVDSFADFEGSAVPVLPSVAFYGGLGDLLATALLGERAAADEVHVAYWLDGWHPTPGTRTAGRVSRERRGGRRVRFAGGRLEYRDDAAPVLRWPFPEPLGPREVVGEFTMADVATVPSHLAVPEVRTYMAVEAARDVAAPDTPAPRAAGSAQEFAVDVVVRVGRERLRAVARGRDIYAVTAPIAVEAVHRVLTGRVSGAGVLSAGAAFDAADFLRALSPRVEVDLAADPGRPEWNPGGAVGV